MRTAVIVTDIAPVFAVEEVCGLKETGSILGRHAPFVR